MTTPDLSHTIPRRLDDAGKFLFWERDVAGIGLLGTLVGVGIGYPLSGLTFGLVLAYGYSKLKAGKHPGIAAHGLYWLTGWPALRALPGSHLRELNG